MKELAKKLEALAPAQRMVMVCSFLTMKGLLEEFADWLPKPGEKVDIKSDDDYSHISLDLV